MRYVKPQKRIQSMRIKNKYGKTESIEYMVGEAKYTRTEKVIPSLIDWWSAEETWRTLWFSMNREQREEFNSTPVEARPLLRTNMINKLIMDCITKLKEINDKFEQNPNYESSYNIDRYKNFIFSMETLVYFRNEYPEASCLGTTVQRAKGTNHIRVYKNSNVSRSIWDIKQIEEVIPEMITPLINMAKPILKKALDAQHTSHILQRLKENKGALESKRKKYEKALAKLEEVKDLPDDWEGKQKELEDWKNAAPDWVGHVRVESNAIKAHKSVPSEKDRAELHLKWDKDSYENCIKAIANGTAYLAERGIVLEEEE